MSKPSLFPYSYTFEFNHPRRYDRYGRRWDWLYNNIGLVDVDWAMDLPWEDDDDLVFYFRTKTDLALFVLTWG